VLGFNLMLVATTISPMSTKETICWGDYGPTMSRKSEVTLYEFAFVSGVNPSYFIFR
jgi:hypothetical protein